jgi:hypothetical protein
MAMPCTMKLLMCLRCSKICLKIRGAASLSDRVARTVIWALDGKKHVAMKKRLVKVERQKVDI